MKLKALAGFACLSALVAAGLQAAPPKGDKATSRPGHAAASVPDFWYVVPGEAPAVLASELVRGIVIPSSVDPAVQTTAAGSVVSWQRPDGTRQSFAVQGVSSFTFKPGPLKGTTFIPFVDARRFQPDPWACCSCASWQNSVESLEHLSCVVGCIGCGCEGCICSPTFPCPTGPEGMLTLKPHDGSAPTMSFGKSAAADGITVVNHGRTAVRFRGEHLSAGLTSKGESEIIDPETITLEGPVQSSASVRGDKAFFAWSSSDAAVIVEQPHAMSAPSFRDGTIDLKPRPGDVPGIAANGRRLEPVMDRCMVCGTHPNSDADLDLMDCVPGSAVCYRCIGWECFTPGS